MRQRGLTVLLAAGLATCTWTSTPAPPQPSRSVPSSQPSPGPPPAMARIVCADGEATVLTPVVAAQPDGIHFQIDNVSDGAMLFVPADPAVLSPLSRLEFADHGDNEVAAHSLEAQRWVVPPGTTAVTCTPSQDFHPVASPFMASLEIADPQKLYVPIDQDVACGGARAETWGFSAPPNFATSSEAYAAVRREFRGVRPDDVLRRAGYPDQPHAWVWIIRAAAKVALVSFGPGIGMDSSFVTACANSSIRPR
jgi:hypothetical protein